MNFVFPDPPREVEFKDDQWLGVTVKSGGPGGVVVVSRLIIFEPL